MDVVVVGAADVVDGAAALEVLEVGADHGVPAQNGGARVDRHVVLERGMAFGPELAALEVRAARACLASRRAT